MMMYEYVVIRQGALFRCTELRPIHDISPKEINGL